MSGSQREPHFQWNIGGVGSSGVGHVHFMYISCCLCIIFRVGYAKISRRRGEFQWNMGLKPVFHQKLFSKGNKIETNNMKSTCPTETYSLVTQHELIPPGVVGFVFGAQRFALGAQGLLDTNI